MFNKAEISKLSVEHQDIVAKIEFNKLDRRRRLWEQAHGRGFWRKHVVGIVCTMVSVVCAGLFMYLSRSEPWLAYPLGVAAILSLIGLESARVDSRLDALLELMDLDREKKNSPDRPEDM